ncbi:MAG: hypothetical protein M3Y30_00190 [Gemmatimonadota bacterium]|nr:hypothetical protein [Gemmatimonadota bacterium]
MRRSLFVAVAVLLAVAACKSSFGDIPKSIPLGVVTVAMQDAPAGVHSTSPAAYFVDAVNVSIPNSATSADTCAQLAFPGLVNTAPLAQIDAGTPVMVATVTNTTPDTALLTPQPADVNGYVFYRLPAGDSIRIKPGSSGHVSIPGTSNGFNAISANFVNADSLKIEPIDATADSTGDLLLTWNPQVGPTASVVVQLEFSTTGAGLANSQIFCQFTDNGSHAVEKRLANLWRAGSAKHVHAYRFLTSISNDGTDQLDIVSQYSTDSTTVLHP